MRKFLLLMAFAVFALYQPLVAQNVYWANDVIEFSSQLSDAQYSANQILGQPNVLPQTGESPNAWLPKQPNSLEFIKVGFKKALRIQQIAIAESFNPSAIKQVFAYDKSGNEYLINEFTPRSLESPGRVFNFFFDMTEYEVVAVKLVLDGKAVPGYNGIDAIAISDSNVPIKAIINITEPWGVGLYADRLSSNVNTPYNELAPIISPDGNTLYFSRQNHPDNIGGIDDVEDIWVSERSEVDGEWKMARNIGAPLNNKGPNFVSSITPDGNTLVLGNVYKKNDKMESGVSITTHTSTGWTKPEALEIDEYINLAQRANFYLANNRKVLLMSIDDGASFGYRDLYVSFEKEDGTWSKPLNIGTDVNTAVDETAPFLAPDDKTLYFSSAGYAGMGKADIYVTKRLDDTWTNWSEPANLGPEINSPNDDEFFNITFDGKFAYYSQNITEGDKDIFRVELDKGFRPTPIVAVKGKVLDKKTGNPVAARIFYEQLPEGNEVGQIDSDPETGEYQILLPLGILYGYLAEADGYISISANVDLKKTDSYRENYVDLYLVPIEEGQVVRLNNIFFDFDKSVLKSESYPELDRIVVFLQKNPNAEIAIDGYTDNIGPEDYNLQLSQNRANAVYNYFTSKGIKADRLKATGFGEANPVANNEDGPEFRAMNRRVEFRIIKK